VYEDNTTQAAVHLLTPALQAHGPDVAGLCVFKNVNTLTRVGVSEVRPMIGLAIIIQRQNVQEYTHVLSPSRSSLAHKTNADISAKLG